MQNRYAIVIAVDGLRASALGAYGNAWHPTPALDRLASESLVFDWMIADSPQLAGFYRAAWFGLETPRDGVERELTQLGDVPSMARRLESAGIQTALTTDDQWVAEQADQLGFSEVRGLEFPEPAAADAVADTELAQLFAIAADQIESWGVPDADADAATAAPPRLLWIHSRGYHGAWDAPTELRQSLLDEEDPPALEFVVPPARLETNDHDEQLLHRSAYAAQTIVLDQCVGMLLGTLDAAGLADSTLIALVGCRGFALGEHGAVGSDVRELYSELTHVPLIVRLPDAAAVPPPRSSDLIQPDEIASLLMRWFEATPGRTASRAVISVDDAIVAAVRGAVFSFGQDGETAVRTGSWVLRQPSEKASNMAQAATVELFSKPDDRWEANEIADRCPDEAAAMVALAAEFRRTSPSAS